MGIPRTISRINARWAALTATPCGVVRCAFLTPSQRAWCDRAIPQIAYGDDTAEHRHLRPTTAGRVKCVAAFGLAEPLRRASALTDVEPTLAPEADRVHCSRSDQAGIAVHNVLPPIRSRALQRPPATAVATGSILPELGYSVTRRRLRLTCGAGYARNLWPLQ